MEKTQPEKKTRQRREKKDKPKVEHKAVEQTVVEESKAPEKPVTSQESWYLTPDEWSRILRSEISALSKDEQRYAKSVRQCATECELNPAFMVRDFGIKSANSAKETDNALVRAGRSVWQNLKDGNSILEVYNPENFDELKSTMLIRQGLPRFFELQYDFVSKEHRNEVAAKGQLFYQQNLFAAVKAAFKANHEVEVFSSLKVNGDTAHISYCTLAKAWVIASRNVTLLAQDLKSLQELYPEESRYFLARKIGECWFNILDRLSAPKKTNLRKELSNKTLVGEFVGNPELANIIQYSNESILFHSMVRNDKKRAIWCMSDSQKFIKKLGLEIVPVSSIGKFKDFDSLCDQLEQSYKAIRVKPLSQTEEGAVLSFVQRSTGEEPSEVLSMTKIKAFEYQFFSNMIQQLQNASDKKELDFKDFERHFTGFLKEQRNILKHLDIADLPHPETFYADVFSTAFNMLAKSKAIDRKRYIEHLFNDQAKFAFLVLDMNETKNKAKKYVGTVDFDSQLFADTEPFDLGKELQRQEAANKKVSKNEKAATQKETVKQIQEKKPEKKAVDVESPTPSGPKPELYVLVAPPFGLSLQAVEKIKANFNVVEVSKLIVSKLQIPDSPLPTLVLASTIDGLAKQASLCVIKKLVVFKLTATTKDDFSSNFYTEKEKYYVSPGLKASEITGAWLRKEIDKQMSFLNKGAILKLGNPAQIVHKHEDEVLVVLRVDELNLTIDNHEQLREHPVKKAEEPVQPKKKQPVKKEKEAPKKERVIKQEFLDFQKDIVDPGSSSAAEDEVHSEIEEAKEVAREVNIRAPQLVKPHFNKQQKPQITVAPSNKIVVLIPVGIPGMGKTYYLESHISPSQSFLPKSSSVKIISQEETRKLCAEKWLRSNPGHTREEAVAKTSKDSVTLFQDMCAAALTEAASAKPSSGIQVIYLDKNHPPAEIKKTIDFINSHEASSQVTINKVAVVPTIENAFPNYPFSLNFLLQCYMRCLDRPNHISLSNFNPHNLLKVELIFFQQFKGIVLDNSLVQTFGFDSVFSHNFTLEHPSFELPSNLDSVLSSAIASGMQCDSFVQDACEQINFYKLLFGSTKSSQRTRTPTEQLKSLTQSLVKFASPSQHLQVSSSDKKVTYSSDTGSRHSFSIQDVIVEEELTVEESPGNKAGGFFKKPAKSQQSIFEPKLMTKEAYSKPAERITTPDGTKEMVKEAKQAVNKVVKESITKKVFNEKKSNGKQGAQVQIQPSMQSYLDSKKNIARALEVMDEFEEVGAKKKADEYNWDSESSEEFRAPQSIGIKLNLNKSVKTTLSEFVMQSLDKIPTSYQKTMVMQDNLSQLQELFKGSGPTRGGWRVLNELILTVQHIGKDHDIAEESELLGSFKDGKSVDVSVRALIFVPGKFILGVAFPQGQKTYEKCPALPLLTNDWFRRNQISQLMDKACGRNGAFKDLYGKLASGEELKKADAKHSQINMGRDAASVSAYMIPLEQPLTFSGTNHVFY